MSEEIVELPQASTMQNQVVDRATSLAKQGYETIRRCGDCVNDILKLDALEGMEGVRFVGRFAEMTGEQAKTDLALFMSAIQQIGAVLEANDGALSKAMARLSVYGV